MHPSINIPSLSGLNKASVEYRTEKGAGFDFRGFLSHPWLWMVYVTYLVVLGIAVAQHEPWGDEVHSWNIAKGSGSYVDLIYNTRYEGHPPTWYTILWIISAFTHDFTYVQVVHAIMVALSVFVILFISPFPLFVKTLIPFGYYFLFEYAVLSRNYAIGVLAALCICIIIRRNFRYKLPLYYFLLLVMSNTHLIAMLLAGALHLYFLLCKADQSAKAKDLALLTLPVSFIFLLTLYFIARPSDGHLNFSFFLDPLDVQNIIAFGQAPLRSFIPVPAWWDQHFWNTQFLLDGRNISIFVNLLVFLSVLAACWYILRDNKKALILFGSNFAFTLIVAIALFPLSAGRYAGFLFIGFIISFWLYCYETPVRFAGKWLLVGLLGIQLVAGIYFVWKDFRLPFSNAFRVNELIRVVPANEKTVTDYWALNTIAAFAGRPFYCVDLQKEISFLQWGSDLGEMMKRPYRYQEGVRNYFTKTGVNRLYMISCGSPQLLFTVDPQLSRSYCVELVDKLEGAIEKGGNLYLYKISAY